MLPRLFLNGWLSGSISGNLRKRSVGRSATRVPGRRGSVGDRRLAFERLEHRRLLTVSGTFWVNGTVSKSDNIVLFNGPDSMHVDTTEKIKAVFTNTGTETCSAEFFQKYTPGGGGLVTFSPSNVDGLAPGKSATVYITPTHRSNFANDVTVDAHLYVPGTNHAAFAPVDTMTIVTVDFKAVNAEENAIYSADTPPEMLAAGDYRITPRKNTPVEVFVEPDLAASGGQSVTLRVLGQSADNGTVTVNGGPSYAVTKGTDFFVNLMGGGGDGQTKPAVKLAFGKNGKVTNVDTITSTQNPHANQLHLSVEVGGQTTQVQSAGFSVAAIPNGMRLGRTTPAPVRTIGFNVAMIVLSDSGNSADLGQVGVGELVQDTKILEGYIPISENEEISNGQYAGPASTHAFNDKHTTPLSAILSALTKPPFYTSGTLETNQVYEFVDARTGMAGIAIDGSGYVITKTYTVKLGLNPTISGSITKQGDAVAVVYMGQSFSSTTGGGKTINAPFKNVALIATGNSAQPSQWTGVPADSNSAPALTSTAGVSDAVFSALGTSSVITAENDPLAASSAESSVEMMSATDEYFRSLAGEVEGNGLVTLPDLLAA